MNLSEKERLRYRKQYVIAEKEIDCPFQHNVFALDQHFFLYTHIDLIVTAISQNGTRLILLGDLLDWEFPQKSNADILNDLIAADFSIIINNSSKYAGRFVLIHIHEGAIRLMHDATACRKIYYLKRKNLICASQPHLLARVAGINRTTNSEKLKFYQSEDFHYLNNADVGDLTVYDEILQLLPNHYLNLSDQAISRYWGKNIKCGLTLNETADMCSNMIKGYMKSIANRYPVMLPVTAGKDSRTLLAATREISDSVFYYINKENRMADDSMDITVPKKVINDLGYPFHILDPYIEIDPDFAEVYYENNPNATAFYLPMIYNYYVNFSDKVNIPGNFVASAYDMYGSYIKKISPKILALLNHVNRYGFALDYYKSWIDKSNEFCIQNNINALMLFYWEERLANWGTKVQIDKDIAQEDLIPYNSRQLIHYFFSIKPEYIDRPDFFFFKKIIGNLWCELLITPTNPSAKNKISKLIHRMGLLEWVRKSLYLYQIRLKSLFISRP